MKRSFIEKQKSQLIKKFHVLLSRAGVDEYGKQEMLASYGVESSKDLNVYELTELCGKLDMMVCPDLKEEDVWRKRLIGAIGNYLSAMGKDRNDMDMIASIACRAAKVERFNQIPKDRLRSLYNAFNGRAKDIKTVSEIMLSTYGMPMGTGLTEA